MCVQTSMIHHAIKRPPDEHLSTTEREYCTRDNDKHELYLVLTFIPLAPSSEARLARSARYYRRGSYRPTDDRLQSSFGFTRGTEDHRIHRILVQ